MKKTNVRTRTYLFVLMLLFSCVFSSQAALTNAMVLVDGDPALVPGLDKKPAYARAAKSQNWLKEPVKTTIYPLANLSYSRSCTEDFEFPQKPLDVFISHLFPDQQNAVPNQRGIEPLNNITSNYLKNIMQALVQERQKDTFDRANLFNQLAKRWKVKIPDVKNFAEFYWENRSFWQYYQQKDVMERTIDGIRFWNLHRQSLDAIMLWSMRCVYGRDHDVLNHERILRFFGTLKDQPDGVRYLHTTPEDVVKYNQERLKLLGKRKSEQEKFLKNMHKLSFIDAMVEAFANTENRQKVLELWDFFAWSKLKNAKDVAGYLDVCDQSSIQILGLEEFYKLSKEFSQDKESFWRWPASYKQFYIIFTTQNAAFNPSKYSQARVGDITFSDCVETALFDVITHAIAEKREGIIYLNRDKLNHRTPIYSYLEEFSDMAANRTVAARNHRANIVANLPANLGIRYSKNGCELFPSLSTLANAMIYLLGLSDQHRLSERASQDQVKKTYDAIGNHLGVTFKFQDEVVHLMHNDNLLGLITITHGQHIEYLVIDSLEGGSSFSDLFGKVKTYEDAFTLAEVANADSYLNLQAAIREFTQPLTFSQNVEIYKKFAQQAVSNEARIIAAYEGFRVLATSPEKSFSRLGNETKKHRKALLQAIEDVTKELSDANDPATTKKFHEHINLNYMQGHMKAILPVELAKIISAAPNLFRLVDRREPKAPNDFLATQLNIQGGKVGVDPTKVETLHSADPENQNPASWNVLPEESFGDLRADMADNRSDVLGVFAIKSDEAEKALAHTCHILYVNPYDRYLNYVQFTNIKTVGFNPCVASNFYDIESMSVFNAINPLELRLLGLAHVDELVKKFLPSLVQDESHRFKMLSLGDNLYTGSPLEVIEKNNSECIIDWLIPNNHQPQTPYGELVSSFITDAFRVIPEDKVINLGQTQDPEKWEEIMKYASAHHWPLNRLRVEIWHSKEDKISYELEDAYYRHGVRNRDAPVFQTFSGGFAEEKKHPIQRLLGWFL